MSVERILLKGGCVLTLGRDIGNYRHGDVLIEGSKINDPIGVVVRGMDSSNVDSVCIAGKARKRRGQLLDVDRNRVKKMAYESRDYVVSTSGFKMPAI